MEAELNMENISACAQNSCGLDKYKDIVQLYDKDRLTGRVRKVFPITYTQAVYDGKTGASLESILAQYNNVFLQFMGTAEATRALLPKEMRRKGIQISYRNMEDEVIVEKCVNDSGTDDTHWGLSANWARIDELSLSGEISVSAKGTWIINGEDTGIKAVGPKGDNGLTPWLKTIDNKLYHSYDNKTWEPSSDYIAAWFRFTGTSGSSQADNIGKIQISRDEGNTWTDLSGTFTNNLRISGYRTSVDLIPEGQPQGAIWAIGPTYASDDTAHTNPIYRLHVKDESGWVDNGQFTSIAAGVVQELGDSETEVISQKAVTDNIVSLKDKVSQLGITDIKSQYGYIATNKDIGEVIDVTPVPSESTRYSIIKCKTKDLFLINGTGGNEGRLWAFTDSEYKLISKSDANLSLKDSILYAESEGYLITNLINNIGALYKIEQSSSIYKEHNVSAFIFNANKYNGNFNNKLFTFEEASKLIPESFREASMFLTFRVSQYTYEMWQFTRGDVSDSFFLDKSCWVKINYLSGDDNPSHRVKVYLGAMSKSTGDIMSNLASASERWISCTPRFIKILDKNNNKKKITVNCGEGFLYTVYCYDDSKIFLGCVEYSSDNIWIPNNTEVHTLNGTAFVKFTIRKEDRTELPMSNEITFSIQGNYSFEEEFNSDSGTYPNNTKGLINIESYINLHNPYMNEDSTTEIQDVITSESLKTNYGILRLPSTYSSEGEPTPLIVFCHGSIVHYNATSLEIASSSNLNIDYLLSEGFAVMDIDGNVISSQYAHCGSPMGIQAYLDGIKWVQDRFNVTKSIYLAGHSLGGLTAGILSTISSDLNIKAICLFAPASSMLMMSELIPDAKDAYCDYFGLPKIGRPFWSSMRGELTEAEKNFFYSNIYKWQYSSFLLRGDVLKNEVSDFGNLFISEPSEEEKYYYNSRHSIKVAAPIKIFQGTNDQSCLMEWTNLIVKMIENSGQYIEYRKYNGVTHDGTNGVTAVGNNTVTTMSGKTIQNVPTPQYEMINFFRKFK